MVDFKDGIEVDSIIDITKPALVIPPSLPENLRRLVVNHVNIRDMVMGVDPAGDSIVTAKRSSLQWTDWFEWFCKEGHLMPCR